MSHTYQSHPHIKDISVKLQNEINGILATVDDSKIHGEFREIDMVDIENGVEHDVMRESLDARIQLNMKRKKERRSLAHHVAHATKHIHHHTLHSHKKPLHKTVKYYLDILFKPFEM